MKPALFEKIIKLAIKSNASDVHFKVNLQPMLRINKSLLSIKNVDPLQFEDIKAIASTILPPQRFQSFFDTNIKEMDFSLTYKDICRFRANIFKSTNSVRLVLRIIPRLIPELSSLLLPQIVNDLPLLNNGLILVTGATGAGKSTTLASMIEYVNVKHTKHIVTIEDPIEYEIHDKKSLVSQREIGADCLTFSEALRASFRQDPDIIMVGEMRDQETISAALAAAETGHLVLATLHTIDCTESINRILTNYQPHEQQQIRHQLASVLRAIISQRLIIRSDNMGLVPAVEILINNTRIQELIIDPKRTREIKDVIAESNISFGMQTFDQSLIKLYKDNFITKKEALKYSTDPNQFKLKMKGIVSDKEFADMPNGEDIDLEQDGSITNIKVDVE